MRLSRFTPLRLALGIVATAALFGCDSSLTVPAPESTDQTALNLVGERVSQSEKERALRGEGGIGSRMPSVSPMNYGAEQIPYQAGPTNLANQGPTGDDQILANVPIGFDFQFYGDIYSTLHISSNGFIRFGEPVGDSGCCAGRPIPLNDAWNNIIAVAWTDLNPAHAATGEVRYETLGTAPNRQFVVHYNDVTIWPNSDPRVNSWLILHEGSNVVEIHTDFLTPGTQNVTQGLENADGSEAHFIEGRVATVFSLNDDGVRFTPLAATINVDIHRIYSGDPPRGGDTINLGDEWVYVEILDPLQYRPTRSGMHPFQRAEDVRIGTTWESGVPAESYELVDINSDGTLDFRGRWDLQELQDAGRLPVGTPTLRVWGNDGDQRYRGEHQVTVTLAGQVLYDNGPWITHPGQGAGGADVHMAATDFLASNVRRIGAGPHFRVADRFEVPSGGWNVNTIITRALINDLPSPAWNYFSMNIWDGVPGAAGSNIVASTSSASFAWSGAYAVFQGFPIGGTDFPVYNLFWSTPGLTLSAGTYWIDWQVDGSAAWAIYTTAPNPDNPNQPILVPGVGRQLTDIGWQDLLQGEPGVPHTPGTPFVVIGSSQASGTRGPAFVAPSAGQPAPTRSRADAPGTARHLRN